MASRELEITVSSARDLKNVNWRYGPLRPYAVLWVDRSSNCSTRVDDEGDTSPVWNETVVIPLPPGPVEDQTLYIDVFHARSDSEEDTIPLIGSAKLKLHDVIEEAGYGKRLLRSLHLNRPSGRAHGNLEVKVAVKEPAYRWAEPYYAPPYGVQRQAPRRYPSPCRTTRPCRTARPGRTAQRSRTVSPSRTAQRYGTAPPCRTTRLYKTAQPCRPVPSAPSSRTAQRYRTAQPCRPVPSAPSSRTAQPSRIAPPCRTTRPYRTAQPCRAAPPCRTAPPSRTAQRCRTAPPSRTAQRCRTTRIYRTAPPCRRPSYGQNQYAQAGKPKSKLGMGTGLAVGAVAGALGGLALAEGIDAVEVAIRYDDEEYEDIQVWGCG